MKYTIKQTTEYIYDGPVSHSINQCKMEPLSDEEQRCLSFDMVLEPDTTIHKYVDYWGNHVQMFYLTKPHHVLRIKTESEVELQRSMPTEGITQETEDSVEIMESARYKSDYAEYLVQTDYTQLDQEVLEKLTMRLWGEAANPLDYVRKVNTYIYENYTYRSGATHVETSAQEFMDQQEGVCQDFTHFMLSMLRFRGVAARYVSGFVYCGQDSAMRGDAATHAWVEAALPVHGWVGLDPTNNIYATDQHIRIAVGRDYSDIAPFKGVYRGGKQKMNVSASVSLAGQQGGQ
jgi:transglutaminase-like putative cysteine protease